MPTRTERLKAHSSYLLDGFLSLRQTYGFLEPMIFDARVYGPHSAGRRNRGFTVVREHLFFDCVQDIANLTYDRGEKVPSIVKMMDDLADEDVRRELREAYSAWNLSLSGDEEKDPAVLALIAQAERREEEKRRSEFDEHYAKLLTLWSAFSTDPVITGFKKLRDKYLAHTELHFDGLTYKALDIKSLGVKWKDLSVALHQMQEIVVLLGHLIRSSDFAWDDFDKMLARDAKAYWGIDQVK